MKTIFNNIYLVVLFSLLTLSGGFNFAFADQSLNSCEHFDNTTINVLTLENASADTRQKIENVEETIDNEIVIRDSILSTVKTFLGLQKKDKVIFREMKKDMVSARNYYDELDIRVSETWSYLDENFCEDTDVEKAQKLDEETQDLVIDEETFRKQFAASLKEKMKILQSGLEEVKK